MSLSCAKVTQRVLVLLALLVNNIFLIIIFSSQDEVTGSVYGGELDYVFGLPISGVWPHLTYHYTRAEAVLSAIVISYWANFVKDGLVPECRVNIVI